MERKSRSLIRNSIGVLFVLFLIQINVFLQVKPSDLSKKYPEIEGIYELQVPGAPPKGLQVYFRNGKLRTIQTGDTESPEWKPVEGKDLEFSGTKGQTSYLLAFVKDEQDRYTRFRIVIEKDHLEVAGVKKSGFDDAKADPASPSDRMGYFERHYTKSEHQIPMRDGIRLFTQVFSPIDQSELHPIIFFRTPYGIPPYGDDFRANTFPSLFFAKENYILVYQDIRGMSMSEGTFQYISPYKEDKKTAADVDESSDAYDSVEWLLKNVTHHNGKVGVWGVSYPGFTAAMAAISAHPAVLAVSPQAPMADLFVGDDGHHNGALYLAHYADYLYSMGQNRKEPTSRQLPRPRYPTPDGYSFYLQLGPLKNIGDTILGKDNALWNETMAHGTYDDYWKARSIYQHLHDIKPAILTVGGWYDAEDLLGTLRTYKTIEKRNPGLQNTLVMGPWYHSGWNLLAGGTDDRGVFSFSGTRTYFQEKIELPFFNYYLKGKGPLNIPEVLVFETGTDQWRSYDAWPPAEAKERKLLFADDGRMSFDPSPESPNAGFDEYISDPAKPVPYTMQTTVRYNRDYFVEDQRFAASRPDVLAYAGDILTENLTIAGPIKAELYVSTTGTDADWIVKVIDVYPNNAPDPKTNPANIRMGGYQRLIRGDVIRGKFRNSFEKPEPFVPGQAAKVEFELPDVQHTFLKEHRIMIQVQSSWFPLFDRNPQTFCDIGKAGESDFRKATHRLYHTRQYPSGIVFNILTK